MPTGTVLTAVGGVYTVELPSREVIEAVLRGRLKRDERADDRVVAGDDVRLEVQEDGRHVIVSAEPRRSQLARRAPGPGRPRPKIIAANVDRVVIVLAAARPEPNPRMLDRFLVLAEANQLPAVIVLNKVDLLSADGGLDDSGEPAWLAPYRAAGYRTLLTSTARGAGIEELRELLCHGRSVLTGPSGVGKSSLLNAVQPGLGLRIGGVSEVVRKGKHTTVSARLIRLECGGYVADTPGLREVGMWGVEPAELAHCFPEFRDHLAHCRYTRSCSHTHEPGCGVQAAVADGGITEARYQSYVALRTDTTD